MTGADRDSFPGDLAEAPRTRHKAAGAPRRRRDKGRGSRDAVRATYAARACAAGRFSDDGMCSPLRVSFAK